MTDARSGSGMTRMEDGYDENGGGNDENGGGNDENGGGNDEKWPPGLPMAILILWICIRN